MRLRALLGPPLVLGLLWAAAVWWPAQSAISSAEDRQNATVAQQLSLVDEIDRLNKIEEQLATLDADLVTIATAIPTDADIDGFLSVVSDVATASGVQVTLLSPTEILGSDTIDANRPVPNGMSAVSITLEAGGSYEAVMAFTQQLRMLPRLVVVDHLSMAAIDGTTQTIVIDMSLRIFSGGSVGTGAISSESTDPAAIGQEPFDQLTNSIDAELGGRERTTEATEESE